MHAYITISQIKLSQELKIHMKKYSIHVSKSIFDYNREYKKLHHYSFILTHILLDLLNNKLDYIEREPAPTGGGDKAATE